MRLVVVVDGVAVVVIVVDGRGLPCFAAGVRSGAAVGGCLGTAGAGTGDTGDTGTTGAAAGRGSGLLLPPAAGDGKLRFGPRG